MSSSSAFNLAATEIRELKKRPSNDELLQLYALFKQGTVGDVTGKRPGRFAMKKRAKYDAWSNKRGMGKEDAQRHYVHLVRNLKQKYS